MPPWSDVHFKGVETQTSHFPALPVGLNSQSCGSSTSQDVAHFLRLVAWFGHTLPLRVIMLWGIDALVSDPLEHEHCYGSGMDALGSGYYVLGMDALVSVVCAWHTYVDRVRAWNLW